LEDSCKDIFGTLALFEIRRGNAAPVRPLIAHYAPARERYNELLALPHEIDSILGDGAARLLPIVTETLREVKEEVGLA